MAMVMGDATGITHLEVRIAALRLVYIAAACAEAVYDMCSERAYASRDMYEFDSYGLLAVQMYLVGTATLSALASIGDEVAVEMMREAP